MGRLSVLLDGDGTKQERITAPSYLTEEKINEVNNFLIENNNSLEKGYVDVLSAYLLQVNGYFNQLLVRGEEIVGQDGLKEYKEQAQKLNEQENDKRKNNLEEVLKKYNELYKACDASIKEELSKNHEKKQLAETVSTINDLFSKIDVSFMEADSSIDSVLAPLVELYKKALGEEDKNKLATLTLLLDEEKRILANDKENRFIEAIKAASKEKVFDLFDKINDQIIGKEYKKVDDLLYAKYKLENGGCYYAIIKNGDKVLSEEQDFKTFTNFVMSQEEVDKNLKIMINNIIAYYDLNEYTRYIEMIYKKQMTKEVDDSIAQYKTRLTTMENVLKSQLEFMDDIAPILNGKTSPKYPNIFYNDSLVKDFYPVSLNETSLISDEVKEQRKLMVRLADDAVPNKITTKDALTIIYGSKIANDLVEDFQLPIEEEIAPKPVIQEEKKEEITSSKAVPMTTNYQKISDYIATRKKELNLISINGDSSVKISEDKGTMYQNVNTIFDLNVAAAISDNQYKNGQGIFAITHYLQTGEANRFTSSFNARNLATSVKPNAYTSLLLENMIKSFAGSGKKSAEDASYMEKMQQILSFVKDELSKENFSATDMRTRFLQSDNLLQEAIKKFDYDYLDPTSENSKLFDQAIEIGVNNNNQSALRIKQAITDIKTIAKDELLPQNTQSQALSA